MFRKVIPIKKTKWIYEWLGPYSTEKTWPLVSFDELCLLFGARPVTFQRAKTICKRHVTDFAQSMGLIPKGKPNDFGILPSALMSTSPSIILLYPSVIGEKIQNEIQKKWYWWGDISSKTNGHLSSTLCIFLIARRISIKLLLAAAIQVWI